jgi:hypothetical protein
MAANAIYAKLEQGSKRNKNSESWFGTKKRSRHEDPLLYYLYVARNSDEHSLELVSSFGIAGRSLHKNVSVTVDETKRNVHIDLGDGTGVMQGEKIAELSLGFYPQPVTSNDRKKIRVDLPDRHLNQPIDNPTAATIATLAISYLEAMVAEADALPSG